MSQVSTSFQDSNYSSSNLPSVTTLQADISAIETAHNDTDANAVKKDGTVAFAGNQSMGGYKITNVGTPTASTDAVTLAVLQALYPVGTIYINASVDTNPGTLFGFGTWELFGAGRVIVGKNASDGDFNTLEKTGGAKTHTLSEAELPSHAHSFSATTSSSGSHTHGVTDPGHTHSINVKDSDGTTRVRGGGTGGGDGVAGVMNSSGTGISINADGTHNHTVSGNTGGVGSGSAHNNLQPYVVCNAWKRVS